MYFFYVQFSTYNDPSPPKKKKEKKAKVYNYIFFFNKNNEYCCRWIDFIKWYLGCYMYNYSPRLFIPSINKLFCYTISYFLV